MRASLAEDTTEPTETPEASSDLAAARLAAIVDSSDDAIVSKTLDGIVTSWNRAAEKMFGYSAAEVIGKSITLIIPPERLSEEDEVLSRIRRGDRVDHFETVRVAKDGRLIDISLTVSPIRNAAGVIVGASKIARDITERKRAEDERRALLAREQAARAEAEALNRSKDQFLAVMSHELRTPLNAVYGWARMLHAGQLDQAASRRATEAILRNAAAQAQLVDDLLDVSRIITGNMRLEVGQVDLKTVIEAALDTVRPAAQAKAIDLQSTLDPDAGHIVGDASRLQQVVWNLLMNAVKFTPKGGRVWVRVRRVHSMAEIVVSDTGEGISAELLPHIFERFRQGDSSSTRSHRGLGIGLALVRHLVDLHGGRVRAESPGAGMGATFTVELPIAAVLPAASSPETDAEAAVRSEPGSPSLRGVRVLVVDDDIDALDLVTLILHGRGAEVKTAASVDAALGILESWPTDVLVSDIEMPGEDGYTLLRRARSVDGRRVPALALTAYGGAEDRKRALAVGFNLHVAKPVDPTELSRVVASLAGRTG